MPCRVESSRRAFPFACSAVLPYYFTYTAQTILQLNRFLDGNREKRIPLYFCLEWEKTSQNRRCFQEGWNMLQEAISKIFAHAIVLEILNQTELTLKMP